MPAISVPAQVFPGFKIIGELSDGQISDVVNYLKNMEIGKFFGNVASDLGELIKNDGDYLLKAIISFIDLTDIEDVDLAVLAKNLAESYKELSRSGINTKETNRLKSNLLQILSNLNNLKFTNLIRTYKIENSNNFAEAKLLTDIRLIPDNQNLVSDRYGVVIHKLYLEYQCGHDFKELHLHIGIDDLNTLKDKIESAIETEKKLRETFQGNIKLI